MTIPLCHVELCGYSCEGQSPGLKDLMNPRARFCAHLLADFPEGHTAGQAPASSILPLTQHGCRAHVLGPCAHLWFMRLVGPRSGARGKLHWVQVRKSAHAHNGPEGSCAGRQAHWVCVHLCTHAQWLWALNCGAKPHWVGVRTRTADLGPQNSCVLLPPSPGQVLNPALACLVVSAPVAFASPSLTLAQQLPPRAPHLELQVSAPHDRHVLLFAELGVAHGQAVVVVLHLDQLVVVAVPLLLHLVVPVLEGQQLHLCQRQLLLLVLQLSRLGQQLTPLQVFGLHLLLQLDDLVHQEVREALVALLHCGEGAPSQA